MPAQLKIEIDPAGLQKIAAAGQYITVAHHARGPAGPMISWIAFEEPFVTNFVRWEPAAFLIYMTNTLPFPGETIRVQHPMSAELGWTYTFDGDGFFGFHEGPADVCTIVNPEGGNLFFGLAYRVELNGKSIIAPINVAQLPNGSGAFAPGHEVSVYLGASPDRGRVSGVPSDALTVAPPANVVFDDKTNTFRT